MNANHIDSGRAFPPVTQNLYQSLTAFPEFRAVAQAKPPVHPDGKATQEEVMARHRRAFESECEGQYRLADYYWNSYLEAFEGLSGGSIEASRWSQIVDEIFVDSHIAFINGSDAKDLKSRAVRHFRYLKRLVASAKLTGRRALGASGDDLIDAAVAAKRWSQAEELAQDRVTAVPGEDTFALKFADVLASAAYGALSEKPSDAVSRIEASALKSHIDRIERVRRDHNGLAELYDHLSELEFIRAVKLANGSRPSQALEAIAKSEAYRPGRADVQQANEQILALLERLKVQMAEVQRDLSRKNATLNAEGVSLAYEASRGSQSADQFRASGIYSSILNEGIRARKASLFRAVKAPIPQSDFEERYAALAGALQTMIDKPAKNADAILPAWRKAVSEDHYLATLEEEPIRAFIAQRCFDEEPLTPTPAEEPTISTQRASVQMSEPFGEFFRSRQGRGLRRLVYVAAALVVLSAGLTFHELRATSIRSSAYADMLKAADKTDYAKTIDEAERFLQNSPWSGYDKRVSRVRLMFAQALVQWAATAADADVPKI